MSSKLSDEVSHHASRVLRLTVGATIELFNGDNRAYTAEITAVSKKSVDVKITAEREANVESDLKSISPKVSVKATVWISFCKSQ